MILVCPSCATRFNLDESRLGGLARRVRCSRCKYEWVQAPEAAVSAPAAEPPPSAVSAPVAAPASPLPEPPAFEVSAPPEPPPFVAAEPAYMPPFEPERPDLREMLPPPLSADDPLAAPRREGGGGTGVTFGWIALFLIVAVVLGTLYFARERVMEIWPPSVQAYEMLGLVALPPGAGLAIQDIATMTTQAEDGTPAALSVKGRVVNISRSTRRIPPLRASLRNAAGEEVRGWDFGLPRQMLAPGESADFDTRLDAPPAEALNLIVVFTPPPQR